MNKQQSLIGFILIGLGAYFFIHYLNLPLLSPFYSWSALVFIIGAAFLLHSYMTKDYSNLFTGALITGIGLHYLAIQHTSFWIDHWGAYLLLIGISFLLHYQKNKKGLIPALVFIGIGLFALFAPTSPIWFQWFQEIFLMIERFWPIALIGFGIYLLKKK